MGRRSRTRYAVLGFLTWGPMSGYDIKKMVEESVGNFWSESYGQIYPILARLDEEGLVRPRAAADVGRRERRVYEITAAGRRVLREWLAAPTEPGPVRNETLLKMFFARTAGAQAQIDQIERLLRRTHSEMGRLAAIRERLEGMREHPDGPYWLITLRMGELQLEAQERWCGEAIEALRGFAGAGRDDVAAAPPRREEAEEIRNQRENRS